MAPLKFEENIKDALAKRTIQPSKGSWDKLASKLDQDAGKKRPMIWWAIAAGFIGVILIGSLLFTSDGSDKPQEFVQEDATEQIITPKNELTPKTEVAVETPTTEDNLTQKEIEVVQESIQTDTKNIEVAVNQSPENAVEKTPENLLKETPIKTEVAVIDPTPVKNEFENKVEQVVNQILDLQAQNSQVSEAEVAALLDAAQKDLKNKSLVDPLTQKVDAMALLDQVEFDLERSFRDKVFDALGDGFNKIRTAMAERNN